MITMVTIIWPMKFILESSACLTREKEQILNLQISDVVMRIKIICISNFSNLIIIQKNTFHVSDHSSISLDDEN